MFKKLSYIRNTNDSYTTIFLNRIPLTYTGEMFPWQREVYDSKTVTSLLSLDASRQQMNAQQKKTVFLQYLFEE